MFVILTRLLSTVHLIVIVIARWFRGPTFGRLFNDNSDRYIKVPILLVLTRIPPSPPSVDRWSPLLLLQLRLSRVLRPNSHWRLHSLNCHVIHILQLLPPLRSCPPKRQSALVAPLCQIRSLFELLLLPKCPPGILLLMTPLQPNHLSIPGLRAVLTTVGTQKKGRLLSQMVSLVDQDLADIIWLMLFLNLDGMQRLSKNWRWVSYLLVWSYFANELIRNMYIISLISTSTQSNATLAKIPKCFVISANRYVAGQCCGSYL